MGHVSSSLPNSEEDPRVRLLTGNPTPGVFENYSYLLAHARGSAILFLGDDDLLEPRLLEFAVDALADPRVVVAYAAFEIVDGEGRPRPAATNLARRFYGFETAEPGI